MASYIEQSLLKDETIKHVGKHHWMIFVNIKSFLTLFIYPLLLLKTNEFAVTNKRVFVKSGIVRRDRLELNLNRVESVSISQGVLGRMLGYGDVIINGSGGNRSVVPFISNPTAFRSAYQELA